MHEHKAHVRSHVQACVHEQYVHAHMCIHARVHMCGQYAGTHAHETVERVLKDGGDIVGCDRGLWKEEANVNVGSCLSRLNFLNVLL